MTAPSLDRQFDTLSERYGISTARLKAVYFRGVREFWSSDFGFGTASMYGLARVQRYVNGDATQDVDLRDDSTVVACASPSSFEFTLDSDCVLNAVYADGSTISRLFAPGQTEAIQVDDGEIIVTGSLDSSRWLYRLDLQTGDSSFALE